MRSPAEVSVRWEISRTYEKTRLFGFIDGLERYVPVVAITPRSTVWGTRSRGLRFKKNSSERGSNG